MKKLEASSRWFLRWRKTSAVDRDDPADMGTCFGMEFRLTEAAAPDTTRAAPLAPRRRGLMARWVPRRRRTAAESETVRSGSDWTV